MFRYISNKHIYIIRDIHVYCNMKIRLDNMKIKNPFVFNDL